MKNMAKLANIDITNKNSQITVLEKQLFVSRRKQEILMTYIIIPVTVLCNEMSLKAYSDIDVEEYKKITSYS